MALPPVEAIFLAKGHEKVVEAFRSVLQAAESASKAELVAAQLASKAMRDQATEAARLRKELEGIRSQQEQAQRAMGTTASAGKAAANDNARGIADVAREARGLASAFNLAASSVKAMGSFLLNDILKPHMAGQLRAQQISNAIGVGAGDARELQRMMGAVKSRVVPAGVEGKDVEQATFMTLKQTKSVDETKKVMDMASGYAIAFGDRMGSMEDIAGVIVDIRQQAADARMTDKQTANYTKATMDALAASGEKSFKDFAKVSDDLSTHAASFGGKDIAANRLAMTRLMAVSADSTGKGAGTVFNNLKTLMSEASGRKSAPGGRGVDLTSPESVAALVAHANGQPGKLQGKTATGMLRDWEVGFSAASVKALERMNLFTTYNNAYNASKNSGATEATAVGVATDAVASLYRGIVNGSQAEADMKKKTAAVEETAAYKFEYAMIKLKGTLTPLAEKFEDFASKALSNENIEKFTKAIKDAIAGITEADIKKVFKSVKDALLGFVYILLDILAALPGVKLPKALMELKNKAGAAIGANGAETQLGATADTIAKGMSQKQVEDRLAADRLIHPENDTFMSLGYEGGADDKSKMLQGLLFSGAINGKEAQSTAAADPELAKNTQAMADLSAAIRAADLGAGLTMHGMVARGVAIAHRTHQ